LSLTDPFGLGEPGGEERPGKQIDLKQYLYVLRRRWKVIAAAAVLALAGGAVHFVITPKEYVASTIIQIERRTLNVTGEMAWLENWWNMEYYPTQYELLQSRGLAEEVVRQMRLMEDPSFNPGGWDGVGAGADADRAMLGRLANSLRAGLTVAPVRTTQLVRLSYRSSDPVFAARAADGFAQAFIDRGVEDRSVTVGRAQEFLRDQIDELQDEMSGLEAELTRKSREADLVGVSPETAVGNQRLESLNTDYVGAKRTRITAQSRYEEANATPAEVVASRHAREVIDPLVRAQNALESDYDSMRKTFKPDWPPLVELRDKVERGRREVQEAIQREARRSVQSMYSEYQSALREERRMGQELEALKEEVLDQSSAASQLGNLRLEIESRRELLNEMLRRQSEADVAARQQRNRETNVEIVDHALVPGSPAYPSLRRDLTFALGAGLLLGLVVVVLLELLDRTLKNAEEAEKLLGLPVLAVIPDLAEGAGGSRYPEAYGYGGPQRRTGTGQRASARAGTGRRGTAAERKSAGTVPIELVPHSKPRLAVSEGYRGLRTALLLSTADELRVVAVTSAGAGEGKTVTATNLAVVLAQLGRRVLLLDCDLRKPRLHRLFQLSNREGVVTYLTGGRDAELAVYPTEVPGLAVTPSGPAPPNPSELLSSDRMAELLAGLRTKFDFVILDTPPVLPVTDAVIVSAMTDGAVLCARAGKVLRDDAVACRDRLRRADVRVLGTVLNGFRSAHSGAGKRYHYYETYAYADEAESGSAA